MSPEQVPPIWPQASLPDTFEVLGISVEAEAGAVAEAAVATEATTGDGIVEVEMVVGAMYAAVGAGVGLVLDKIEERDVMLEVGGTSTDPSACELSACF